MLDQLDLLWNDILENIKQQITISTFKSWFTKTKPVSLSDTELTISTPNNFIKDWIQNNYHDVIKDAVNNVTGIDMSLKFLVNENQNGNGKKQETGQLSLIQDLGIQKRTSKRKGLNQRFTFNTFIIADSNRFAHAAAQAVAERPALSYNPLFIYGGVGLGKTHLLQAIAHYALDHFPHLRVKYVSSETFTNDFIKSIGNKDKIYGFHKKYRQADILLVDDIQFLEKKEQTQMEFFHTFNTLYSLSKQIVISSDRPPKELATLEERLKSRFASGLITDIQPPALETRMAILIKKAEVENIIIPVEVIEFIAENIKTNIRELEGALTRVTAYSSIYKQPIAIDLAKEVLKDIISRENPVYINIEDIIKRVGDFFSVTVNEIKGAKRAQNIVYPRQVAMYLSRELTDHSLPSIGVSFGNRDHTTVLHGINKIHKLIKEKSKVFNEIQNLTNLIKQGY